MGKKSQPVYVKFKCEKCGGECTIEGKTFMDAYNYAMQKYGWGPVGLDKWMCDVCWARVPVPANGEA
jgi:hypothetical protein